MLRFKNQSNFMHRALLAASISLTLSISTAVIRAEPSPMSADDLIVAGWAPDRSHSPIAAIARRHVGATAAQLGLPRTLWCGDFANLVRRSAGLRVVPSRRAIDQARYGRRVNQPVPGALMITGRRGGAHVDLIVTVHADGTVTTIGGNISRRVAERRRAARGIIVIPS